MPLAEDITSGATTGHVAAHEALNAAYNAGVAAQADLDEVVADLTGEVADRVAADATHAADPDPHPGYLTPAEANAAYWPLSTDLATQTELNAEAALARNADNLSSGTVADERIASTIARDSEVTAAVAAEAAARNTAIAAAIANLIASAPGALDTLDELAAALGDDANFAATITTALAGKQAADAELAALAGLASAADRVPYFTGSGTATLATFTAAGRALVDDADPAAQRATLGLGAQPNNTDLRTALINLGLLTAGGATPLNLNGGALTCAAATATGTLIANSGGAGGGLQIYDDGNGHIDRNGGSARALILGAWYTVSAVSYITSNGDVECDAIGTGLVAKSSAGIRYRLLPPIGGGPALWAAA